MVLRQSGYGQSQLVVLRTLVLLNNGDDSRSCFIQDVCEYIVDHIEELCSTLRSVWEEWRVSLAASVSNGTVECGTGSNHISDIVGRRY